MAYMAAVHFGWLVWREHFAQLVQQQLVDLGSRGTAIPKVVSQQLAHNSTSWARVRMLLAFQLVAAGKAALRRWRTQLIVQNFTQHSAPAGSDCQP
jgi:hypothetical protein